MSILIRPAKGEFKNIKSQIWPDLRQIWNVPQSGKSGFDVFNQTAARKIQIGFQIWIPNLANLEIPLPTQQVALDSRIGW